MVITSLVINIKFFLKTCTIVLIIDRTVYPCQNLNIHEKFWKVPFSQSRSHIIIALNMYSSHDW